MGCRRRLISRALQQGCKEGGCGDLQHIALVRAPTNAQGSEGVVLASVNRKKLRITHTFVVRLTEYVELARDTLDKGLINSFEETVRVWIRLDNLGRRRIFCLLGRVKEYAGRFKVGEQGQKEGEELTFCLVMRQKRQGNFRAYRRYESLERREDGIRTCRKRVGVGLRVWRKAAIGWGRGRG